MSAGAHRRGVPAAAARRGLDRRGRPVRGARGARRRPAGAPGARDPAAARRGRGVRVRALGAAAAPLAVHAARAAGRQVRQAPAPPRLLGAAGACAFVLAALKLPSVTGSSSHPTGTGLGAILFRPPVMALLGTIVLTFQALLLA